MNSRKFHLCLRLALAVSFLCQPPDSRGHGLKFDNLAPPRIVSRVSRAKWTIMLYMNGDNNLDKFAIADFEEMAKVRYDPQVNVVVQLDRLVSMDTDEDWGETRRFLMRENLRPTRSNSFQNFNEEANMGDPATLASFVEWSHKSFPAERYMLVIWSHGDGWRRLINDVSSGEDAPLASGQQHPMAEADELLTQQRLGDSKLALMNSIQSSIEPQFRTISEDQTNNYDKLYIREIQDALEGVCQGDGRLEAIGFDACLMQMIETGYALRNVADIMLGSEELEPSEGWKYDDWLQQLVLSPDMDGTALSKTIVASYQQTYEREKPNTTLSAVRISSGKMKKLAAAVSALAVELMKSLDAELPAITQARMSCRVFAPRRGYHGIDLHRFCSQLAQAAVNPQLRSRARKVMKLMATLIIHNYSGKSRQGEFGSMGLAIYFPASSAAYQTDKYKDAYTDENEFQVVQFVKDQLWDNFLQAYFKRV